MWSELKMPVAFSSFSIYGQHGARVEIIAFAMVPVEGRGGISRAPVDQIQGRIIGSGQPGGRTALFPALSLPCFVSRFPWFRHCPASPNPASGFRVISIQEATKSSIAS